MANFHISSKKTFKVKESGCWTKRAQPIFILELEHCGTKKQAC